MYIMAQTQDTRDTLSYILWRGLSTHPFARAPKTEKGPHERMDNRRGKASKANPLAGCILHPRFSDVIFAAAAKETSLGTRRPSGALW